MQAVHIDAIAELNTVCMPHADTTDGANCRRTGLWTSDTFNRLCLSIRLYIS